MASQYYCDPKFAAETGSLFEDAEKVAAARESAESDPGSAVLWKRPAEISPQEPSLFVDGEMAGDVVSSSVIDDAWFVGALATIAAHPLALMQNLFVTDVGPETDMDPVVELDQALLGRGSCVCRFYVEGEWQEVKVDSLIPTRRVTEDDGIPMDRVAAYGRSRDPSEHWVSIVEKAYAKLCGSYDALHGGDVADALVDLTGGSAQRITLTDDSVSDLIDRGELWGRVQKYLSWNYVLACARTATDGDIKGGDMDEVTGLLHDRAYGIIMAKEIGALRFIKIRNPWGARGDWRGEWSQDSPKWDEHPEVEQAMKEDESTDFDRNERDGTMWLVWADFVRQFDTIYLCRLFGEEFNQYLVQGEWAGASAGGAHRSVRGDDNSDDVKKDRAAKQSKRGSGAASKKEEPQMEVLQPVQPDKRRGLFCQEDGDSRWFNNPQYRIVVDPNGPKRDADVFVSLVQRDRRLAKHGNPSHFFSNFVILRQRRGLRTRVWEQCAEDELTDSSKGHYAGDMPRREVTKASVKLSPKYSYIIVPHTREWGVELPYTMRLFSKANLKVEALPELHCKVFEGEWTVDNGSSIGNISTAGGPLKLKGGSKQDNPTWCNNPQYLVRIPSTKNGVTIKAVVVRTDKTGMGKGNRREGSRNYVGLVVTKPEPPHNDGKKRRKKATDFMGNPISPHRKKAPGARDAALEAQDFGNRAHMHVDRKLSVAKTDWCCLSEYSDRDTASALFPSMRTAWCEDGIIISPTLLSADLEGSFVLKVWSDYNVRMEELPQRFTRTVPGAWAETCSGGCHMNADWKRNPKFVLSLLAEEHTGPANVTITLSRPEDRWARAVKLDTVGTMMGFYLMAGTRVTRDPTGVNHEGKPWTGTAFMPIHEVSTPQHFTLQPLGEEEVYTIVPATFEPGQLGPFFVTVSADCEFSLSAK